MSVIGDNNCYRQDEKNVCGQFGRLFKTRLSGRSVPIVARDGAIKLIGPE